MTVNLNAMIQKYEADLLELNTAIYREKAPSDPGAYSMLGWIGELGEAAEKMKKCLRDNAGHITDELRQNLQLELGDICWYIVHHLQDNDLSLEQFNLRRSSEIVDEFPNEVPYWIICAWMMSAQAAMLASAYDEDNSALEEQLSVYLSVVFQSVEAIAILLGSDLPTVLQDNLAKLASRKERSVLQGSGDNR